jgi:hypothetical protein
MSYPFRRLPKFPDFEILAADTDATATGCEGDRLGAAPVDLSFHADAFFPWPADEEIPRDAATDLPITVLCDPDSWPPAYHMLRFVPAGLRRRAVPHFPFAKLDLLSLEPRASIILIYPPPPTLSLVVAKGSCFNGDPT